MIKYQLNVVLLSALALLATISFSTEAQTELPLPNQPHVVVNGYGYVEAVPDVVRLRFQVTATAKSFKLAKQSVDAIVGKVFAVAAVQHIPKKQIDAAQISASPQYQWQQKQRIYQGEQVSRQIEITLMNTSRYNDLVNALFDTGIQRLSSVQVDFQQRQTLQQRALIKALDNATQQAKAISQHLAMQIKTVYQVAPRQQRQTMNRLAMSAESKSKSEPIGLVLTKQKLEQHVRVVYLLE